MIGSTLLMEYKMRWKGLTLFLLIILLCAGGFPQFYPAIQTSVDNQLEGAENVKLTVVNETVELSWINFPNVTDYMVIEDNKTFMITPTVIYNGTENHTQAVYDQNETQYFAVLALFNGTTEPALIGMATTAEGTSPFDQLMESSFYKSFVGDRDISMTEITGFLSVEFYSWWFILAGLYVGYISVSSVARDFEEKRMDLIFSTPISRKRYLLEKFAALSLYTLLVVLLAGGIMIASINSLGMGADVDQGYIMLSLIASWPVLLIMQAVGILFSVYFADSRPAVGMTLMFGFFEYALQIVANMAEKFSYVGKYGILGHWDYNQILFDKVFGVWDFIGLIVVAALLMVLAIMLFDKKDIPV
ncbi:MAG: ABC transporter permease [Thermoplasmata archaeon]